MQDQFTLPDVILTVSAHDVPFYTTLLQSGVEIKSSSDETIGHFLNRLPGFSIDYVSDTVQTIFLNGTAVDDLTSPLGSGNPVLALSAAMPGLAGAIFRRNSFHAALRTSTESGGTTGKEIEPTLITLKLFNSIALERGSELLELGVCIKSQSFLNFLSKRATLLENVLQTKLSGTLVIKEDLIKLLTETKKFNLKVTTSYE